MVSPILLIAVPLGLALATPLLGLVSKRVAPYVPVVAMLFNLVVSVSLLPHVREAPIVVQTAGWAPPYSIHLVAGPLGVLLSSLIALIGLLVAVYGIDYIREGAKLRYHVLYILILVGATGVVLTGDIFNLFVFFEVLCISSYALVAYRGDSTGVEAGAKYLVQGAVGSSLVLIGVGLLYGTFGTLTMADIAANVSSVSTFRLFVSLAFLITGFGVEAAVFPLNGWLPDAHSSAPSSISAILSGIAIKAGIYAVARVIYTIYGAESLLLFVALLGIVTLLIGEMCAFGQDDIKRLLAYSSIGQMGLIVFALGLASAGGVEGALFLVVSHGLAKALLFLASGYMIYSTGSRAISSLNGLGSRMPLTALCFTIGAFSLVGLPPFVGFASKFMIVRAALQTGDSFLVTLLCIALVGTVVEGAYFLRVVQGLYFKPVPEQARERTQEEAPLSALVPVGILAALILAVGIWPGLVGRVLGPATNDLLERSSYVQHVMGGPE
jgi:proton-translocating NADH-quinone oxidoreductase chain N